MSLPIGSSSLCRLFLAYFFGIVLWCLCFLPLVYRFVLKPCEGWVCFSSSIRTQSRIQGAQVPFLPNHCHLAMFIMDEGMRTMRIALLCPALPCFTLLCCALPYSKIKFIIFYVIVPSKRDGQSTIPFPLSPFHSSTTLNQRAQDHLHV